MTNFLDHPNFALVAGLGLPAADFVIGGSGPLFARGWTADIGDVDIIARGAAWDRASALGVVEAAPHSTPHRVLLFDGRVEVLDGWFPERWDTDKLIDEADVIQGVRFLPLGVVVVTKRMLRRPQDEIHLRILAEHGVDAGAW